MADSSALDLRPVAAWGSPARPAQATAAPGAGLLFGLAAAPFFWLAQITFARVASALLCERSFGIAIALVRDTLLACDGIALAGAFAGGLAAFATWRRLRSSERAMGTGAIAESRLHFLAMWGMMASLWLFGAILFNAMGSVPVQACAG